MWNNKNKIMWNNKNKIMWNNKNKLMWNNKNLNFGPQHPAVHGVLRILKQLKVKSFKKKDQFSLIRSLLKINLCFVSDLFYKFFFFSKKKKKYLLKRFFINQWI